MSYCFPNTLPSKDVFSRIKGQLWLWYKFPSFLGVNILCKFHQWRNALWYILHTTYLFKVGVDGRVQDTLAMSLIHHYKGLNLKFKVQMYVIYHIKYTSIYVTLNIRAYMYLFYTTIKMLIARYQKVFIYWAKIDTL